MTFDGFIIVLHTLRALGTADMLRRMVLVVGEVLCRLSAVLELQNKCSFFVTSLNDHEKL